MPRWLENDLSLDTSLKACREIAGGIIEYCGEKGIPFGFNIESVSIRKAEIVASIALAHQVASFLGRSKNVSGSQ